MVYVCQSNDKALLSKSASGGAFSHLARIIIGQGGAVFGAAWKHGLCKHVCVRTEEELAAIRGSKYVRSSLGDTFEQAKALLDKGVPVLYSGTPCQLAALSAFLKKPYTNLYAVDLVCHGLPDDKIWDIYASRFSNPPSTAAFRDKTEGWRRYSIRLAFPDGSVYRKPYTQDTFMRAYISNLSLREACLRCKFNTSQKRADITLGDDWGGELRDCGDLGTSLLITHTEKGDELFEKARGQMRAEVTSFEKAAAANPVLLTPSRSHKKREEFLRLVDSGSFDKLVELWDKPPSRILGLLRRLKRKIIGH